MDKFCKLRTINFSKLASVVNQSVRNATNKTNTVAETENKQADYEVNPNYLNRNPRNLEWTGHAHKRRGWHLQYPAKDYYHKCFLELKNRTVRARIEHSSGKTIIEVKSSDAPLKQYLYSLQDKSAIINVARVLADRCHKYGIAQFRFEEDLTFEKSTRKQLFRKTLIESGVTLEEPEYIEGDVARPGLDYENKNFFHQRRDIPFPPFVNKLKQKFLSEAESALEKKE